MRKRFILIISLTGFALVTCISCFKDYEEEEDKLYDIEIQPEGSFGKDALIMYHPTNNSIKNSNHGETPSLLAAAWEINDTLLVTRSLLEFNISGIKVDAEIIDAKLSLYFNPTDEHYSGHSTTSGSNAFWIERITDYWTEDSVTWNSKPETIRECSICGIKYGTQSKLPGH